MMATGMILLTGNRGELTIGKEKAVDVLMPL